VVNKQVLITFAIGKYKEEVWCDVVQWKQHMFFWEDLGNMIEKIYMMALPTKNYFNFHGHKIILKPLSPKEVNEDQIKM